MKYNDITEVLWEFGKDVLAHQKCGQYPRQQHRLVYCCTPPQLVSPWVRDDQTCSVHNYTATWDEVTKLY
jgi:hypothetical protein